MPTELILKNAEYSLPTAIANLERLKAEIAPKMEYYRNIVVTEDSIKAAKADKANLNRLKKAIDEQRIAVKRQCLEPYNALEKQCRELESLIVAPITAIDTQIKAFEETKKQAKYSELQEYFNSLNETDWITLEDVLNPKWANKSEKNDSLKSDIEKNLNRINAEYSQITELYSEKPYFAAVSQRYKIDRDFSSTLAYAVYVEKEYMRNSPKNVLVSDSDKSNDVTPPDSQNINSVDSGANMSISENEKTITGIFEVTATEKQLIELRRFMESCGIRYTVK